MAYLAVYAVAALVFLVTDALWLRAVMSPLFERHVGDLLSVDLRLAPAAAFYACYVAGILYFCVVPGLREASLPLAIVNGVILGFLAYGAYEATNLATLRGWTWTMAGTDVAWGMTLTGMTAGIGWAAGRKLGLG